ncbi:MAG: epoxyqueuosine reductase [Bacteriovoracaceae bacterium]
MIKNVPHLTDEFLKELGVVDWGMTSEEKPTSWENYEKWVSQNLSSPLTYLSDHRMSLRSSLKNIYPEFQTALVFFFDYAPTKKWLIENKIYKYAAYTLGFDGGDYHHVVGERLEKIGIELKKNDPTLDFKITLDVLPVLERDLAFRAGLGWFGKNSMLIHRKYGSYFLIGSLLINKKIQDQEASLEVDHCGQCNRCVEACPTKAINPETRTIIASQCISTYTIEIFKEATAPEGMEKSRGEIFGCDICQDVCPWNKKYLGKITSMLKITDTFQHVNYLLESNLETLFDKLSGMSGRSFKKWLKGTSFDRPGVTGWLKNIKSAKNHQPK